MKLPDKVSATLIIVTLNMTVFACMVCSQPSSVLLPSKQLLTDWGANYGLLTLSGQFYRLFSSLCVHVGVLHLAINSYVLLEVGDNFEKLFGWRRMLYVYILAGVCSGLASAVWNPLSVSAGASGAIFGVYGHYLGFVITSSKSPADRAALKQQTILALGLIAGNMVYGLLFPGMDNVAHVAGFVTGIISGLLAPHLKAFKHHRIITLLGAGLAVVALIWVGRQIFCMRGFEHYHRGIVALREKRYREGEAAFSAFVQYHPNEVDAYGSRGFLRSKIGELGDALDDFSKVIQLDPARAEPYNSRAWVLGGLKRYGEAVRDATECIKRDPHSFAAYDTRGYSLARLGDYQGALNDFAQAIKLNANDPAAYFHRAQVYQKLGDGDKAAYDTVKGSKYECDEWENDLN